MPKLTFLSDCGNRVVDAGVGESVLDAASRCGVLIPTQCGGVAACHACQIRVVQSAGLSALEVLENGNVLACQTRVVGDACVVLLPLEAP